MARHRAPVPPRPPHIRAAAIAALVVSNVLGWVLVAATWSATPAGVQPVADGAPLAVVDECVQALGYPDRTEDELVWLRTCRDALRTPTPEPTATPTTPAPTPTPTVGPTTPAPTTPPPPTPSPSPSTPPAWPGPDNTGVPAGTALTAYTGPCRITTANTVIVGRIVNCTLTIAAPGVTIRESRINGSVTNGSGGGGPTFALVDTEVFATPGNTAVGESNFTLLRVELRGGNRSGHCYDTCVVRDSWAHGQQLGSPSQHAAGMRMGMNGLYVHNTFACDVPDNTSGGGCSAPLTGYPDFSPVRNNRVEGNLFVATPGSACAYGGDSAGKPFSGDPTNATDIDFIGNRFQRGSTGRCAFYGPVIDWRRHPTNSFTDNRFEDGVLIAQPS